MQQLTLADFAEQFEAPRIPVVVTGLTDEWPAATHWTEEQLLEKYADHKFKVFEQEQLPWVLEKVLHLQIAVPSLIVTHSALP